MTRDPEDRVRAALAELGEALIALAAETRPVPPRALAVDLVSPAEFARRASLGRSSTYLAIGDGSIRSVKVRGRRLIPVSELGRLAEAAQSTKRPRSSMRSVERGQEVRRDRAERPPAA